MIEILIFKQCIENEKNALNFLARIATILYVINHDQI
jgi:hypothetical protein